LPLETALLQVRDAVQIDTMHLEITQIDSPVGKLYERWDYESDKRLGLAGRGSAIRLT